jgi:UDP-glucose:(glucosyl)LPS alpha-1,2-glucosyltransferase
LRSPISIGAEVGQGRLAHPSIAAVLPMREQVTGGRAGAVALNVMELSRASVFRDRMLVVGGAEPGDFTLPYYRAKPKHGTVLGLSWPFWGRASDHYADAAAEIIATHRCVLVEVHNRARLFGRLAARLGPRVRLCLYLHNDPQSMEGLRRRPARARLLDRASLVYCLSSYIRDRFVNGIEGPLERVVVLPNGIAPPRADRLPRQKSILFVGRLIPEKGVDELFDALRPVARELPDWRVKIIGRAPERHRSRYQRALRELKILWGERLDLMESVPHAEVMQAYACAAITVVPSRWQEPFGRTALEALAGGSAVIASRSGGLPEIVGQAGLLLDAVTPTAIADAILALASDPARRDILGKAGEARVAACFDLSLLARRLDGWREGLLAR